MQCRSKSGKKGRTKQKIAVEIGPTTTSHQAENLDGGPRVSIAITGRRARNACSTICSGSSWELADDQRLFRIRYIVC